MFDTDSPYKGKITGYDSPIYIADAALYLMKTKPDLGIKDPYALDQKQFDAAVELLKEQKPIVGEYWTDYLKAGGVQEGQPRARHDVAGDREPRRPTSRAGRRRSSRRKGSTAWSDSWMVSTKAKHPNCTYMWLN